MKRYVDGGIELRKRLFHKLSFKVFLITFVMQLLAGALICMVLYLRTPETYLTSEEENTILLFQLTEKLSQVLGVGRRISERYLR